MKRISFFTVFVAAHLFSVFLSAQTGISKRASETTPAKISALKNLYIDVHHFGPGKVKAKDVAAAHQKDLATESKYGVDIINYWLDEKNGDVYCLASSPDSESLRSTHAEAHGLVPDRIYEVTGGMQAAANKGKNLFLDIHQFGPGKVTAKDVAAAHQKDLAVQKKYGVNLINYWVDEKNGTVMCLAQAGDSTELIKTHKEAHGLIPDKVIKVTQHQ
jgi:hypothetical protein